MKHVGHARETVAKATTKGGGKATSSFPGGSGKMGKKDSPMIHRMNKLSK